MLLPSAFLFRVAIPCRYAKNIPREDSEELLGLPEANRLPNLGEMDGHASFADVRLGWNEVGIGVQVEVRGKQHSPQGDLQRPRQSDGLTLWLDTRDARTSHRASRYCHQFHLLAAGAGTELNEPAFVQSKIHRALEDATIASAAVVPFRGQPRRGGYLLEAFLPATVLHGFDPEQNPRLGFYYAVRDAERGEQTLGLDSDFPWAEDPSLWGVLELLR